MAANNPVSDQSAYTIIVARRFTLSEGPTMVLNTNYGGATDIPVPNGVGRTSRPSSRNNFEGFVRRRRQRGGADAPGSRSAASVLQRPHWCQATARSGSIPSMREIACTVVGGEKR